ncbi:hypothetical protein NQZ79_g6362 [Umbelopsis isabellina]|nr:hypothetical protein NQZ79_g6362 [Umbelopsis isabellina]
MSADARKQNPLERQDTNESTSKETPALASSSLYDSPELQALRSGPSYLQKSLGTEGFGLGAILDDYSGLGQIDEDEEEVEDEDEDEDEGEDADQVYNTALADVLDESEAPVEPEKHTPRLQTSLPPIKNKNRVGRALSHHGLISRIRKSKGKQKQVDKFISENNGEEQSGDSLLPNQGMSKMLEDDIRAQNVLLKALKEKLTANLERLKADEAMLLHMFDMTDKDLENVKPLNESDPVSKRQVPQDDQSNTDTWRAISKKLKRSHGNDEGQIAVQGQYVAHSLQGDQSIDIISEEEDEDEPEEIEDEEAALKALNQMISEFADDESN